MARGKGFLMVSASPLTRCSYHAGDDFARLRAARDAQLPRRAAGLRRTDSCRPTPRSASCPTRPSSCTTWSPDSTAIRSSCPGAWRRGSPGAKANVVYADLVIGFKMFRERFSSKVTLHPQTAIDVELHQRPVPLSEQPLALRAAAETAAA